MKKKIDPRTRYSKVIEILRPIVNEEIHINKLWRRVMIDVGSSRLTISSTISLMIDLGMIKEVEHNYYKILRCEADI